MHLLHIFTYPVFLVFVFFGFVKTLIFWALSHFLCKVLRPFCFLSAIPNQRFSHDKVIRFQIMYDDMHKEKKTM
jgi:hypothetical protein